METRYALHPLPNSLVSRHAIAGVTKVLANEGGDASGYIETRNTAPHRLPTPNLIIRFWKGRYPKAEGMWDSPVLTNS